MVDLRDRLHYVDCRSGPNGFWVVAAKLNARVTPLKGVQRFVIVYILGGATVCIWRGIWYILDYYLIPDNPVQSFWTSCVAGAALCYCLFSGASMLAPPGKCSVVIRNKLCTIRTISYVDACLLAFSNIFDRRTVPVATSSGCYHSAQLPLHLSSRGRSNPSRQARSSVDCVPGHVRIICRSAVGRCWVL